MFFRPSLRLSLWAAFAIVGAAYLLRSLVIRNGDFSLAPLDLFVLAVFIVGVLLVGVARRSESAHSRSDESRDEGDDEHRNASD